MIAQLTPVLRRKHSDSDGLGIGARIAITSDVRQICLCEN